MRTGKIPKTVLITGCSSGIGKETANLLARQGLTVFATVRTTESFEKLKQWACNLPESNLHPLQMDVTDESNVKSIVSRIEREFAPIDCLINNAGYGQAGAIEDLSLQQLRNQMETNLIGVAAVTQAVIPAMRKARFGKIINVSSVVAHVAVPLMGAYCSSKHALDALSVTLRMETAQFGIDVILIEPGPIKTSFRKNTGRNMPSEQVCERSPYADDYQAMMNFWEIEEERGAGKNADEVARLILKAVRARKPKYRYRITTEAKLAHWIIPFVPERVIDRVLLRRLRKHNAKAK